MNIDAVKPNKKKAIFLLKKQVSEFVCDAVNLEGINFTLPEVQTLLEGVTIGGHKLSDQTITLNQAEAWKFLIKAIEEDRFELTKSFACELHAIAAKEEALVWGKFRSGGVMIAGTTYLPPPSNELNNYWKKMLKDSKTFKGIYDRAIYIFLQMSRNQFFYDVNKRMGRFMMNGLLLNSGYPAINLPVAKQLEFNELMLDFYQSADVEAMTEFMKSCINKNILDIMCEA